MRHTIHTMPCNAKMSCIKLIILKYTAPPNINKTEILFVYLIVFVFVSFFSLVFALNKMQFIRCTRGKKSSEIITIDMKLINSWFGMYTAHHCIAL